MDRKVEFFFVVLRKHLDPDRNKREKKPYFSRFCRITVGLVFVHQIAIKLTSFSYYTDVGSFYAKRPKLTHYQGQRRKKEKLKNFVCINFRELVNIEFVSACKSFCS